MKNEFFMVGLPAITRAMGRNLLSSKKVVLALCAAAMVSGSVFAQEAGGSTFAKKFSPSVGGGLAFNTMYSEYTRLYQSSSGPESNYTGGGIFAFLDLTYVEIDLDLFLGNQKDNIVSYRLDNNYTDVDLTHFGFSVLGKYPFALGGKFSLFPLVGIDYQIFMGGKNKDSDTEIKRADLDYKDMYDFFSLAVGIGGDFNLTKKLYLRGELMYNFKLLSKWEKHLEDTAKDAGNDPDFRVGGFRIKLGLGCKL